MTCGRRQSTMCESFTIGTIAPRIRFSPSPATSIGSGLWAKLSGYLVTGKRRDVAEPATGNGQAKGHYIPFESNQSHVGIAYPTIPYKHPDYFQAWAAVGVLSSGSSSRLFTEVREKRGLVLHGLRFAPHAARSGERAVLRGHDGGARSRNARRDDRRTTAARQGN